jgi:biopolymer transport protein ExbB
MTSILIAAGWPVWPLLFISVFGLAILLERTWFLRRSRITPKADLNQALGLADALAKPATTHSEEINAIEVLHEHSALGKIMATGLASKSNGLEMHQTVENMRDAATPIFSSMERYLGALATIATIAPLMGLFGTVVGMIEIFGSQSGGANPQQLAHGISIALYNTAFGLLVAIPALAGWRWLRSQADARQQECNDATRALLKQLYPGS